MKKPGVVFPLVVIILCVSLVSSEMKLGLEDYSVADPTPSKPSIKGGSVEHGSPNNPYIFPKPPPPPPQTQDGG
ncbi:unnamed protein product [Thlaspi arvense]|uniref:Transmembrane protein n=1 Tax=Thlaspi arvense TaxID=13288 RepID=A0AAU9T0J8_THLAR|nr:unnamed protein product [Thlaspi arvense]